MSDENPKCTAEFMVGVRDCANLDTTYIFMRFFLQTPQSLGKCLTNKGDFELVI